MPPYPAADEASGLGAASANAARLARAGSRRSAILRLQSPVMKVAARAGYRRPRQPRAALAVEGRKVH